MKKRKKKRPPRTPAEAFRHMAGRLLAGGVISQADVDGFAQRLAEGQTDDARSLVLNEYMKFAIGKMAEGRQRMLAHHGARHPSEN